MSEQAKTQSDPRQQGEYRTPALSDDFTRWSQAKRKAAALRSEASLRRMLAAQVMREPEDRSGTLRSEVSHERS